MPRKEQGWITFQSSEEERRILEQYCVQSQRTKTEILRELVRTLHQPVDSNTSASNPPEPNFEIKALKVSARNLLPGKVKQILWGSVNTEVTLEIAPGVDLVSVITTASARQIGLSQGKEIYAVIKSSNVMLAEI